MKEQWKIDGALPESNDNDEPYLSISLDRYHYLSIMNRYLSILDDFAVKRGMGITYGEHRNIAECMGPRHPLFQHSWD